MATSTNDDDNLLDSDNDELEEELIRDKVTKESFLQLIEKALEGGDLLKVINLLPNSSQRYGYSITMNAIVKIICHHATFKDRCTALYTTKVKSSKETRVVSTYNTLNLSNKELL
jgi:hypothetical protein